jgi:hypothetical protein
VSSSSSCVVDRGWNKGRWEKVDGCWCLVCEEMWSSLSVVQLLLQDAPSSGARIKVRFHQLQDVHGTISQTLSEFAEFHLLAYHSLARDVCSRKIGEGLRWNLGWNKGR